MVQRSKAGCKPAIDKIRQDFICKSKYILCHYVYFFVGKLKHFVLTSVFATFKCGILFLSSIMSGCIEQGWSHLKRQTTSAKIEI